MADIKFVLNIHVIFVNDSQSLVTGVLYLLLSCTFFIPLKKVFNITCPWKTYQFHKDSQCTQKKYFHFLQNKFLHK